MEHAVPLAAMIFVAAILYSSVGHAGASGYLAAMALMSVSPEVMKPTALCLNVIVASIATARFAKAGCFSWRVFWPFAIVSIPFASLGGAIQLPGHYYKVVVGIVLLYAAFRLASSARKPGSQTAKKLSIPAALIAGAGIGMLAGLTGTGGGIFLSPVLLLTGWAEIRECAGVTAAFVLVNSLAGLAGNLASVYYLPPQIPYLAVVAGLGGIIGSELGSRRLAPAVMKYLLAAVLVVASCKLILT
jgi:uncharacterized membrane protein YfcA